MLRSTAHALWPPGVGRIKGNVVDSARFSLRSRYALLIDGHPTQLGREHALMCCEAPHTRCGRWELGASKEERRRIHFGELGPSCCESLEARERESEREPSEAREPSGERELPGERESSREHEPLEAHAREPLGDREPSSRESLTASEWPADGPTLTVTL